jgi:hypothetical protein
MKLTPNAPQTSNRKKTLTISFDSRIIGANAERGDRRDTCEA